MNDTLVTVTAGNPTVAQVVGGGAVVPSGQSSATVLVNGNMEGFTSLDASVGVTTISAAQPLEVGGAARVPDLKDVSADPASVAPGGTGQVLANWAKLKAEERRQKTGSEGSVLDGVPTGAPALGGGASPAAWWWPTAIKRRWPPLSPTRGSSSSRTERTASTSTPSPWRSCSMPRWPS